MSEKLNKRKIELTPNQEEFLLVLIKIVDEISEKSGGGDPSDTG